MIYIFTHRSDIRAVSYNYFRVFFSRYFELEENIWK